MFDAPAAGAVIYAGQPISVLFRSSFSGSVNLYLFDGYATYGSPVVATNQGIVSFPTSYYQTSNTTYRIAVNINGAAYSAIFEIRQGPRVFASIIVFLHLLLKDCTSSQ